MKHWDNIQFAQTVAEKDPTTGLSTFLSGSYGYDALWSTPSSMISHMFLDLLGYHDTVALHAKLFKANQGTIKPPDPGYSFQRVGGICRTAWRYTLSKVAWKPFF